MIEIEKEKVRRGVHIEGLLRNIGNAMASFNELNDHTRRDPAWMETFGGLGHLMGEIYSGIHALDKIEKDNAVDRFRKTLEALREKALERNDFDFADAIQVAMYGEVEAIEAPDLPDATAQDLWHKRGN
tara:strand:+ start:633 stop:1019 length:387 start_codon:yes stop_codon:yes gene_type:complete